MRLFTFYAVCIVLFVVPLIFVKNRVYKDGVFGRFFLCCISGCAFLFILDWVDDEAKRFDPPVLAVLMMMAFAGFLIWHLCRFHIRVLRRKPDLSVTTMPPVERRNCPDRRFQEKRHAN